MFKRFSIFRLLLATLIFIVATGCAKTQQPPPVAKTPTEAVQKFVDGVAAHKEQLIIYANKVVSQQAISDDEKKQFNNVFQELKNYFVDENTTKGWMGAWMALTLEAFAIGGEAVEGAEAIVTAKATITSIYDPATGRDFAVPPSFGTPELTFELAQQEGRWVIKNILGLPKKNQS